MTSLVPFREWLLAVDVERTAEVHNRMEKGDAELCGCNDCRNYAALRDEFFPAEVRVLLANLGIDYRKEASIAHLARLEDGRHLYNGWFHFKGRIASGRDCKVPQGPNGYTVDTVLVGEYFQIGFRKESALNSFDASESTDLVQVEFMGQIPWELKGVPESV